MIHRLSLQYDSLLIVIAYASKLVFSYHLFIYSFYWYIFFFFTLIIIIIITIIIIIIIVIIFLLSIQLEYDQHRV